MDAWAWGAGAALIALTGVMIAIAPRWHTQHLSRQMQGRGGGALSGIGSGFDAVWRPSADEARNEWEAQIEIPRPLPAPQTKTGWMRAGS